MVQDLRKVRAVDVRGFAAWMLIFSWAAARHDDDSLRREEPVGAREDLPYSSDKQLFGVRAVRRELCTDPSRKSPCVVS
ncbi:hypothetical protein GCM10022207_58990 [Streptomyces lannensis]|uniref:Secreted protein n=1 Tax=Streptomyces lannensis TaxID=766498 RepID=A0ABP7KPM0_9ACTN